MPRRPPLHRLAAATLLGLGLGHGAAAHGATQGQTGPGGDDPTFDACVRHLRRTVTVQSDGSHLSRLFALRQLHDPALRPFFYQVAQSEQWQVQVHAILGLAEIDENHHIDPWLVTQVNQDAQEALVANAIDMDLVGPPQMRELLAWEELQPLPRLMLLAELRLAGEPIDRETIARFAERPQHRVAGLASMLLAQLGDTSAFSGYTDRLATLPDRDRTRRLLWVLEALRQYEITAALPWVIQVLDDPEVDPEVAYWGLFTALSLDPKLGLPRWEAVLGAEPTERDRVRYGMILLATHDIPAAAYERLAGESDLSRRMAEAGRAIASGADPGPALSALIDLGHPRTTAWAMSILKDLPPAQAAPVYTHIIETVEQEGIGQAERVSRAVTATARLFEIEPDTVLRHLAEVEDDSLAQEVMLLGLFESSSPAVGEAAARIRRIGAGRADSLALLLIARHAETLDAEDLEQLGRIAAGGGRVSEGLQIQAAWMYLEHAGAVDAALTRIFGAVDR